jgi:hypothetical protein
MTGARYGMCALLLALLLAGCSRSTGHRTEGAFSSPRSTITFPIVHETHQDIVAAVEACRQGVALASWLPQASKAELYGSCDKGLNRGLTEVRQYGEQVCSEVAFTMPSSSDTAKKRVLSVCEAKTKKFAPTVR